MFQFSNTTSFKLIRRKILSQLFRQQYFRYYKSKSCRSNHKYKTNVNKLSSIINIQFTQMGNLCIADQLPQSVINIQIYDPKIQSNHQEQLIRKYSSVRTQVSTFPLVNNHVQQKIKRFSKISSSNNKLWRLKHPYNLVYMNQGAQDQYQLPKGYAKIYKLKENGDFQGYYQGKVTPTFQPDLSQGFFVFHNASYFEGKGPNQGAYINQVTNLKYEGGWVNQQPHGKGLEHNNKGVYQGQYFQGEKHGKGKFIWNDRTQYEGNFHKGSFHGKGHYRNPNLNYQYNGEYSNDLKHGLGVQNKSKQTYTGQFFKNKRCGKGKLVIYQDETKQNVKYVYQGLFEGNKPQGLGTYANERSKKKIKGIWSNGALIAVCQ